jgi:Fe-S-cluster-containing dehydrogenase component
MSEETKKGFLERETTRRDFLKLTGKGIGGAVLSLSILNLFGYDNANAAEVAAFPLATGLLIADKNRCTGCQRCEINCTLINDGKIEPFVSRIKVSRNLFFGVVGPKIAYAKEDGQYGNLIMNPETCRQCKDPACAIACPMKAIVADEKNKGARTVVEEKCIGCGTCTQACPWHLPTVDPETSKSTKCILCGTCAKGCPTSALKLIPWEEVKITLNKHGYNLA